eukprot:scaffold14707_cov176-Ochromonas_danica.AAC.5
MKGKAAGPMTDWTARAALCTAESYGSCCTAVLHRALSLCDTHTQTKTQKNKNRNCRPNQKYI